ncbi:probable E3 ubiquitin-protein ligase ari8 [Phtheirospermum japonicum]|uniref:RBR-type E3 ubiquitin transferase n=1 Tax=Phtheirospermum japonicum TaxID=374723 RepID=A0A830BS66_9LAMI|nr:probable E3 ubiquitin-protein ligase ari8 [Phtheirospermum japonicum]
MNSLGDDDFLYFSDDDDDDEVAEDVELDFAPISRPHKHYKTLKEEEIRKLQHDDIADVSNVLSVSRGVACTLLCLNNWNRSSVYDKLFCDENKDHPPEISPAKQSSSLPQICNICCETITTETDMLSAACGHLFCTDCWRTYISISIQDGPGCLTLNCPEPGCKSHPGLDMVDSLASEDDKDKYYCYLYRSYVESNTRKRKWCPAPGCDFAILLDGESESNEVTCDCGYKLCWGCGEESHSPLECEMVRIWMQKNNSEAENTTWILAYTKPCPKCHRAIEKNQGCNLMTCRKPCGHHFCWLCLEEWKKHRFGPCNGYKINFESVGESDGGREKAKLHLERYTHYYERWDANEKARKKALDDLKTAKNEHVLKFVVEAWEQIVECRRVLKWTYAYGYYNMSECGSVKLKFFEHLQGQAEYALERLHHCAEKEMDKYLSADCPSEDFRDFRSKLVDLTSVTKSFFENLVRALENNLSEVEVVGSKNKESSKKRKDRED